MERNKKINIAFIQELIKEEEDRVFRVFEKKELISRIEERLKVEGDKKRSIFYRIREPFPAILSLLLVTIIITVALLFVFPSSQTKKDSEVLEKYLPTTPGIINIMKMGDRNGYYHIGDKTETFWLVEKIKEFIYSVYKDGGGKAEEVNFKKFKDRNLAFSLEEKIKILLIEKRIHHFLNEYFMEKREGK